MIFTKSTKSWTSEDFHERAKNIRLIVMDVDGVLSDGVIAVDDHGHEHKNFHVRDGSAIVGWLRLGNSAAILSGRYARCVDFRAKDLGIPIVLQGNPRKISGLQTILQQTGLSLKQTCFIGDDLPDLPLFGMVGLAASPVDAIDEIHERSHFVSQFGGGRGAVNDLIRQIMTVQETWQQHIDWYHEREYGSSPTS